MTNRFPWRAGLTAALFLWIALSHSGRALADDYSDAEVPLDGIASVIRFSSADETTSLLLLDSDVELLTRILLVIQYEGLWTVHEAGDALRFQARRLGVIVRMLAHVATQIGEKSDTTRRDKWLARFTQMAGGKEEVAKILYQSGASDDALKYWFGNLQLCRIQLQYMMDQARMPSKSELKKMFQQGDHSLAGASWSEAQVMFEKLVRNKILQQTLADWFDEFEQQGSIRFTQRPKSE